MKQTWFPFMMRTTSTVEQDDGTVQPWEDQEDENGNLITLPVYWSSYDDQQQAEENYDEEDWTGQDEWNEEDDAEFAEQAADMFLQGAKYADSEEKIDYEKSERSV